MLSLYLKALHLIFVVTWFAGLFYLVRLFIYHAEAAGPEHSGEVERNILQRHFSLMARRLWNMITWPSAIGTIVFGLWLAQLNNVWYNPWFLVKMSIVFLLLLYHLQCGSLLDQMKRNAWRWSATQLRLWNEVATLLLVLLVMVAVIKDSFVWKGLLVTALLLGVLLYAGIVVYKKKRNQATDCTD